MRDALRALQEGLLGPAGDCRAAKAEIAAGRDELDHALALRGRGPYLLQAAISSLQIQEQIDWGEVAELYGRLAQITRSQWWS